MNQDLAPVDAGRSRDRHLPQPGAVEPETAVGRPLRQRQIEPRFARIGDAGRCRVRLCKRVLIGVYARIQRCAVVEIEGRTMALGQIGKIAGRDGEDARPHQRRSASSTGRAQGVSTWVVQRGSGNEFSCGAGVFAHGQPTGKSRPAHASCTNGEFSAARLGLTSGFNRASAPQQRGPRPC